jgi:ribosomal protein S18 acetylase RimI-like enzyme
VQVTEAIRGSGDIDVAAQIWAEATAARDGDEAVAALSVSRPVIEAVLARSPDSFVLIARSEAGPPDDNTLDGGGTLQDCAPDEGAAACTLAAGFAAVEPAGERRAQVSYLGVRPGSWGRGVGELLLREVRSRLAATGYRSAELQVYVDNAPAVALYERLGWRPLGAPAPHPRTGKPEQRYELRL